MLQIGGRKIMSSKINIICALLYCLFHLVASESSIEGEDDFRIDVNILKFISEQTALVQQSIELDYVFSVEDGGYKETKYEGKICTASHPDQFFTNCYLPHQQPHTEMIWYFTDRYDHEDNAKFNPSEVKFCRKDMDQVCRYKSDDGNKTTFITHVIIADPDIIHKEVFGLLKRFDNPNDILILRADEDQLELIRNNSIQVNNNITSSVYHQIDFRCGMLKDEASVTGFICMAYIIALMLWIYRNLYHYPRTMTVLHRLLTIPPLVKLTLMMTNYSMLYLCPWYNGNVKMYIILAKILLNLIFETILIGTFFLVAYGFKIARNSITMKSFTIMLVCMLVNYLVIFILMIFNEFGNIGTVLYTCLNISFLIFLTVTGLENIEKLQAIRDNAINNRQPEMAINIKISMMSKSIIVIASFFILEIFYHGVLGIFGVPSTRYQEKMFYIFHESTDCIILISLLFILKTQDYIPYFGIINLDEENIGYNEVEFQQFNDVETLTCAITNREAPENIEEIEVGGLAIIVGPEDPDASKNERDMTFSEKQSSNFRKLQLGSLSINSQYEYRDTEYCFYNKEYQTKSYKDVD